ncbi:MAG: DUF3391 domain-containing protein [Betaproteobacteria bacterium]|nr:DUF3391 domain-containing protein [Betaproteobacteria bacterium]
MLKQKQQVRVEDLRPGMYVLELDRPWLGTPFTFQGFEITSSEQIKSLAQYCKTVFIDKDYTYPGGSVSIGLLDSSSVRGATQYQDVSTVEKEIPVARELFDACDDAVRNSIEALRAQGQIDPKMLTGTVRAMSESIQRNPSAMLLLVKIRQMGELELHRATDTSVIMIAFGRFLQVAPERLELLGLAGLLLDIGKVRIPDAILHKKGLLTADEYEIARSHVKHAIDILRSGKMNEDVVKIVMQHHERQDGSGYPLGLRGEEISLEGSIAAIVDSYSALTSQRPYANQKSPSDALSSLYKVRGKLYHEALMEQFIQCIGIYPVGSAVELNTGEIGIVIAQNIVRRLQPRVMVILDRDMKPIRPQKLLDLVKGPRATPDEVYRIRRTIPSDKLPVDPRDFFI